MIRSLACPTCGRIVQWSENRWRPFCSERCRLIDLGDWLSDAYSIAEDLAEDRSSLLGDQQPAPMSRWKVRRDIEK